MLLYYDEYKQVNPDSFLVLEYYHKLPDYLHTMDNRDILKYANRFGNKKLNRQSWRVLQYLRWLYSEYNIDLSDKVYDLEQMIANCDSDYVGFFSFEDLRKGIEEAIMTIEISGDYYSNCNYDGVYCAFYLQWYGITLQSFSTIRLEDVTELGHKVYIPAENRTIEIDNEYVADILWNYKNTTEIFRVSNHQNVKKPDTLKGDMFFRTTKESNNHLKQIISHRYKFVKCCDDIRFSKNIVYESGRFYQMFLTELNGFEFIYNDESSAIIKRIFNNPAMAEDTVKQKITYYNKYKETLLKYS